ncbi:MAG: O-antigen ligase family protein [Alphaproteobacteria bacterium]|nr:O-antigen ligase family protein [Alphaproteobacteria bacterium]
MPVAHRSFDRFLPVFCIFIYVAAATLGAFTGGAWGAIGIGGAVALFLGLSAAEGKAALPQRGCAFFTLTVLWVWGAELPFSSHVAVSLAMWLRLASIFLPLLLLSSKRLQTVAFSRAFVPTIALAMGIGAVCLGGELISGGFLLHLLKKPTASLTEYNRGMAHMVILSFPIFAGLWQAGKKKQVALLALALLFPASLTDSHTAKLALFVGAVCTGVAFYRPLWVQRGLAGGTIVLMGWPFYAQRIFLAVRNDLDRLHDSFRHRLEIWDYLSYRIAERPVWGWGLGTTHMLDYTKPHGNLYRFATQAAPHAHNFIVQVWVETGLVGLAVVLIFLLWILRRILSLNPSLRPFALGGFAAALTVSLFGFDFWTDALWAAFALSAFVFGMLQQGLERGDDFIRA